MSQRAGSRARGYLSRGALLSLLLHVHLLAPIGLAAWIYGGRQEAAREAQRAQEVDVEFKDVTAAELPKDLPPDRTPPPDQLEPPQAGTAASRSAQASREQEARRSKKDGRSRREGGRKPEPEVPPTPPRRPAPPPEPQGAREDRRSRQRQGGRAAARREVPRAEEQPRRRGDARQATRTSRRRRRARRGVDEVGSRRPRSAPTRQKIAELEDQKSALGRKAPDVTPHDEPRGRAAKEHGRRGRKSLLALRDPRQAAARADARDRRPVAAARGGRRDRAAARRRCAAQRAIRRA